MQTRHRQHADKTEYLVMFHGREESVKSTNVARNKPMSTDSRPKLEHAAWQNGARLPLSHRTRPPRALTPRKVDGTRPSDRRWVSAGFSQGPAYKSRPGLFTRQGQIEVPGSGRLGPWDSKTLSSREVSRDSQRLRRFSLAFPAHARLEARLLIQQIAPRHPSFLSCLPGARSP